MQQVTLAASRNVAFAVVDDVATHIWKQLLDGASELELVDGLVAEYDVEAERARTDLTAFLQRLNQLGLLQTDDTCARR